MMQSGHLVFTTQVPNKDSLNMDLTIGKDIYSTLSYPKLQGSESGFFKCEV